MRVRVRVRRDGYACKVDAYEQRAAADESQAREGAAVGAAVGSTAAALAHCTERVNG